MGLWTSVDNGRCLFSWLFQKMTSCQAVGCDTRTQWSALPTQATEKYWFPVGCFRGCVVLQARKSVGGDGNATFSSYSLTRLRKFWAINVMSLDPKTNGEPQSSQGLPWRNDSRVLKDANICSGVIWDVIAHQHTFNLRKSWLKATMHS